MTLAAGFFARDVATVARDLIGATLMVGDAGGTIVETEAYDAADPASHSFNGATARNAPMWGPPGHAYVYRIYGIHWCLNFTTGAGSAVLIRALAPLAGVAGMAERRGTADIRRLTDGPGKLCQALGVDAGLNAAPLDTAPFVLGAPGAAVTVAVGARIGITRGVETPWRFGLAGSPFLSRPFPTGGGE